VISATSFNKQSSVCTRSFWTFSLLLLLSLASKAAYASSFGPNASQTNYSSYLLNLVNHDRQNQGSPTIEENSKLDHLAQVYADYLMRSGTFGHVDPFGRTPQDRANLFGVNGGVSENLAWESSNYEDRAALVNRAEAGMMNEPPNQMNHRYNILNPESKYIGLGIAMEGDKVIVVQEFTRDQP
jgi:uncharacterized protein YkwD